MFFWLSINKHKKAGGTVPGIYRMIAGNASGVIGSDRALTEDEIQQIDVAQG